MHIFIDESGSFTGYHPGSLSVVGALVIPDYKLDLVKRKYAKIRARLPKDKGEVKGRLLTESQIDDVVALLVRNEVLFELTALDLGIQQEANLANYKSDHVKGMLAEADLFLEPDRQRVKDSCAQIAASPLQLYIQAITTFELLHSIIGHAPLYFAQRQPRELAQFKWTVDGKEPQKVTNWEMWWAWYSRGALATMSQRRPGPAMIGADYSSFEKFKMVDEEGKEGVDMALLLEDLEFSAEIEPGLELADIIVTATRRALVGTLGEEGWHHIPKLMIHRKESYIKFIVLDKAFDQKQRAPYARLVNSYFTSEGRLMLAPRFLKEVARA